MSGELELVGGLAGAGALVKVLWDAFVRRSEKAVDKVDADRDARISHLEKRLEGVASNHAEKLASMGDLLARVDERLQVREGRRGEPRTLVTRLPAEFQAELRKKHEESDE